MRVGVLLLFVSEPLGGRLPLLILPIIALGVRISMRMRVFGLLVVFRQREVAHVVLVLVRIVLRAERILDQLVRLTIQECLLDRSTVFFNRGVAHVALAPSRLRNHKQALRELLLHPKVFYILTLSFEVFLPSRLALLLLSKLCLLLLHVFLLFLGLLFLMLRNLHFQCFISSSSGTF